LDVVASEDQRILQDATRRYLEDRAPVHALRSRVDTGAGFDAAAWSEGAAQGWVGLFVPEAQGGLAESAQGVVDAAIIAEEMGRVVYAGPFLSSAVAAFALAQQGSQAQREELLPGLAAGERLAAWCFAEQGVHGGTAPGGVQVARDHRTFSLNGVAACVQDAQVADTLLVTARDGEGITQFLLPVDRAGIAVTELDALDLGRRLANVAFTDVTASEDELLGAYALQAPAFERQLQVALVLLCAETLGVTERALEFTLEYVQQRYAFGRPIGAYQGLKHRLADHAAQLEGARAIVARAATAVQEQAGDAALAVSIAKSHCGRHGTDIIRDCLQMHGGIGMTWEHDIHFYLRRAVSNEALWGTPAVHHERLCVLAGLGGAGDE